ncbi:MAG TPA: restriction endonuclease [Chloroflexota bacterium]|nr:restriction endonuclease [Chloroflexota bacterium]
MPVPKYHQLFNPVLEALRRLGGSASISELNEEVIKNVHLSDTDLAERHNQRLTKLEYQLHWTRSYLKSYGLLDNTTRGVWILTPKGNEATNVDPQVIIRFVQKRSNERRLAQPIDAPTGASMPGGAEADAEETWREKLLATLLSLSPSAFERLSQRLLRESGFVEVRVTGRSGDGGIDGVGIIRLGGLLGFPILFQCKRYNGSVSAGAIRDFRGAMIGRADRGLVITTGTFTRDAKAEATRDGAPPIDLVDGETLLDKLKELRLGVDVRMIEDVTVLPEWFAGI